MTAPPAGALEACLALLEKAVPGPWVRATSFRGVYSQHPSPGPVQVCRAPENYEWPKQWEANAEAIAAAVNFLRQHGPALLAALRLREGCEWQPIESAPKSSSHILLFGDGDAIRQCVMVGNWRDDDWRLAFGGDAIRPTHWMPLPSMPETP